MPKKKPVPATFAERLKYSRTMRGLSQIELSAQTGIQNSTICPLESGARKPSVENVIRLATTLEVSADFLLGISDHPFGTKNITGILSKYGMLSQYDRHIVQRFIAMMANK